MKIHECSRCEGCGYVTGGFHWEVAWTRWAPTPDHPNNTGGILSPRPCADCGGTGALLELIGMIDGPSLPSRRGIPVANPYAEHVSILLQTRGLRSLAN